MRLGQEDEPLKQLELSLQQRLSRCGDGEQSAAAGQLQELCDVQG